MWFLLLSRLARCLLRLKDVEIGIYQRAIFVLMCEETQMEYTPADICRCFGVPRTTLLRWEADGTIPRVPRDRDGNRVYSQKHFERVGQKLARRLETLAERIRSQIQAQESLAPEQQQLLEDLLAEYSFVSYLINHEQHRLQELETRACAGRLSEELEGRILARVSQLSIHDEEYRALIGVLYEAVHARSQVSTSSGL